MPKQQLHSQNFYLQTLLSTEGAKTLTADSCSLLLCPALINEKAKEKLWLLPAGQAPRETIHPLGRSGGSTAQPPHPWAAQSLEPELGLSVLLLLGSLWGQGQPPQEGDSSWCPLAAWDAASQGRFRQSAHAWHCRVSFDMDGSWSAGGMFEIGLV